MDARIEPVRHAGHRDRVTLRATARAARRQFVNSLTPDERAQLEEALADIVVAHLGAPAILGAHAGTASEISPLPIVKRCMAAGWNIAWPRVQDDGPLAFHAANIDDLVPGHRSILEPPAGPRVRPDVILVPLVAADLDGNRLGQGGGHYDRTLAEARSRGPVLAVGLAFDIQIHGNIATEAWDQPLDAIATPTDFHAVCRRDRSL